MWRDRVKAAVWVGAVVLAVGAGASPALAQAATGTKPAAAPAAGAHAEKAKAGKVGIVGEVNFSTVQGYTYLYAEAQAPKTAWLQVAGPMIERTLQASMTSGGKIRIAGAPVLTAVPIEGAPQRVTVKVGFPVDAPAGAAAPAGLKLEQVPPSNGASLLYTGPMNGVGAAIAKLTAEAAAGGQTPTGVITQRILYFESPDSANNVMMFQVGLE